jgi:hypothetical protein
MKRGDSSRQQTALPHLTFSGSLDAAQTSTSRQSAWQSNSKTRKTWEFRNASQEQRLNIIRQAEAFSGHDFFILVSACLEQGGVADDELTELAKTFVDNHCPVGRALAMNEKNGVLSDWDWISNLFGRLPEAALWQLLRGAIATRAELPDEAIMKLNDSMQGQLFCESHVQNRRARIAFARCANHITFMREAAGGKNVWMEDEEFSALVDLNDSVTLACFARCDQMKPHHLFFIKNKLETDPHHSALLATSYDTAITLMKALEVQGNTPEMAWMRQASESAENTGQLWQRYLEIKTGDLASTTGPVWTSKPDRHHLN